MAQQAICCCIQRQSFNPIAPISRTHLSHLVYRRCQGGDGRLSKKVTLDSSHDASGTVHPLEAG